MIQIIFCSFKRLFRNTTNMFWILIFPIILGTFFYIAFSNLGASESMSTIPVAVVLTDDYYGEALKQTVTQLSEGEDPFLDTTFCSEEEARKLLENGDVCGMILSGSQAKLSVSANTSADNIKQSILAAFVEEFNLRCDLLIDTMQKHPENAEKVISAFQNPHAFNEEVSLQKNPNVDTYTQYFYNLLAMACLYAAMAGVTVAVENQGNLSTLAARKTVSARKKSSMIIGELIAATIFEFVLNLIGFFYLSYILKVCVDAQLPYAILSLFTGVLTGVSLGFFFGTLGKKGKEEKDGLIFAVIMPLCFLSGLMVGNMRVLIDRVAPVVNRINPAALITDSFYCLSIFEGHARYTRNIVTLLLLSILFIGLGILKTRRSRYASI